MCVSLVEKNIYTHIHLMAAFLHSTKCKMIYFKNLFFRELRISVEYGRSFYQHM
uniref:Uncharacterized protein n=1 Tax=Anguilla anguilla TaxID=7936 RepID=A0A0E9XIH5_ANGAN